MKGRAISIYLVTLTLGGSGIQAQSLTHQQIEAAIRLGQSGKPAKPIELKLGGCGVLSCTVVGPATRVAAAAYNARKRYQPFTTDDVTPDMAADTVEVICPPAVIEGQAAVTSVEHIVITQAGGVSPTQPLKTKPVPEEYQNAFGARWQGEGLLGVFPLHAFVPGSEVHVVFSRDVKCGFKTRADWTMEIKKQHDLQGEH